MNWDESIHTRTISEMTFELDGVQETVPVFVEISNGIDYTICSYHELSSRTDRRIQSEYYDDSKSFNNYSISGYWNYEAWGSKELGDLDSYATLKRVFFEHNMFEIIDLKGSYNIWFGEGCGGCSV